MIFDQIIKRALLHFRDIGRDCNIEICRTDISFGHIGNKQMNQPFHVVDIRDDTVGKRMADLNICRGFFIHFISGITVGKYVLFIFDGDHILFHHD